MGALFSYVNLADAGTVSRSSSEGTEVLPPSNTLVRQVGKVGRETIATTSPLSSLHYDYDLGSTQDISYVGIIGHNVANGTYEVRLGTTLGSSNVASESGTLWRGVADDQKYQHVIFDQVYQARYVRVTITPATGQDVDIGRVWVDAPWTPRVSIEFEHEVVDESETKRSVAQAAYSFERPRIRMNRIRFPDLTEAQAIGVSTDPDAPSVHHMDMTVGTHKPIICIPETGGADGDQMVHKYGIYGSIRRSTPIVAQAIKDGEGGWKYRKTFEVLEER